MQGWTVTGYVYGRGKRVNMHMSSGVLRKWILDATTDSNWCSGFMRHHLPVSRLIPPPATLAGVLNMLAGSQDTSLQRLVEQRLTVSDRETC
ncbi:hypothetical protein VTN49DRAFT_5358 [Thermomyces lanuginosus]|uniref:uncharacterized protein n=1 Tax=Thermomyces lanuginosus TaxID=5541 RepID=UPI0037449DBD